MASLSSDALDGRYHALCREELKCLGSAPLIAIDAFSTPSVLLIWVEAPGSQDGGSCIDHSAMSVFSLTFAPLSLPSKQLDANLRIYHKDIVISVLGLHLMTSENMFSDWYGIDD